MKDMGHRRSTADPCLYYLRNEKGEMIIQATWVDDNIIVGPKELVETKRKKIANHIEIDDIGELEEFVGCKVERKGNSVRLMQPVIMQSFVDKFEVGTVTKVTHLRPDIANAMRESSNIMDGVNKAAFVTMHQVIKC